MKVTNVDFMAFQKPGIDMFIQYADAVVAQTDEPYGDAVKRLQQELHDYIIKKDTFNRAPKAAPLALPTTWTLGKLMDRRTCRDREYVGLSRHVVYVIRDGEGVLYVGSTRYGARERLKSHQKAHSPLGEALRTNPDWKSWSVEMIPHADYESAASKEKELILKLRPPFCRKV